MKIHELRDLKEARLFLGQGLWLQRVRRPVAAGVRPALEWALEIAAEGHPLPPVAFVADLGNLAFGVDREGKVESPTGEIPGVSAGLVRTYEDYVLGKIYADWTFERAADALRRYQGRDRARGLSFLVHQFRERAGFEGVLLSPGVVKAALEASPEEVLAGGWDALSREGPRPLVMELYESLMAASRRTAEMLGPEDLFELEHGTALVELGQRVALRQVLQAAQGLEKALPQHGLRPLVHHHQVPTRVLMEDTYPVGGFSSLSTRGSIESLLHSQLAYMEKDRPDLFDIKFLRDELLYYARDDNEFWRRRRTFVLALFPDLIRTRVKDTSLPWQRGVLLLALLLVLVRKLSEWLSTDALVFELVFLEEKDQEPLKPERALLEMLLREPITNGTVKLSSMPATQLAGHCALAARRSLCHCLLLSTSDQALEAEGTAVARLRIDDPCPALALGEEAAAYPEEEDPLEGWSRVLERFLQEGIGH